MIYMTMIGRIGDGLPLVSFQQDDMMANNLLEYQSQAKQLFKKMTVNSPNKGSLESNNYFFHYYIDRSICYLTLCDQNFSKRLAFQFLEDIQLEFSSLYGQKVHTVVRPYSFIEFDKFIMKTAKSYADSRTRRNLAQINVQLQDVQQIMMQNINDVLQRGEALTLLDDKASNLASLSHKYKKNTSFLNLEASYAKIFALAVFAVVLLLLLRYYVF